VQWPFTAQPSDGANAGTEQQSRSLHVSGAAVGQSLTSAVSLTPDQVKQVKAINDNAMSQTLDTRNSGDDPATASSKINVIQRIQRTDIKALLPDEQKSKYDAYLAMQRGATGGATPPAAPQRLINLAID
jgi:hypothetical protein